MDQLPRLGKRGLICLLLFTCNYVVSVWRGFLFLLVLGMGYVILLWHSLSLPYNYFESLVTHAKFLDRMTSVLVPKKVFTTIWVWWPSSLCDLDHLRIYINVCSPFPRTIHCEQTFVLDLGVILSTRNT